jgi:hypothetical protein
MKKPPVAESEKRIYKKPGFPAFMYMVSVRRNLRVITKVISVCACVPQGVSEGTLILLDIHLIKFLYLTYIFY